MINEMTQLMQSHRSIRRYTSEPVPDEVIEQICNSAQWAPSSNNIQAYSIIVVQDPEKKTSLAEFCGDQKWVANCPVFLVFCGDFYRLHRVSKLQGTNFAIHEVENLLVGAIDTALAAENALLAARSLGLGGVMIGGIRNNPGLVAALLKLPRYVLPMMGLCLGYPGDNPGQKPRLPHRAVVHQETYQETGLEAALQEYDVITVDYYSRRTGGQRAEGWLEQMGSYLSTPRRPHLKKFIVKQGFELI